MARKCPYCEGAGEVTIGRTVMQARKRKGMSQEKLAKAVGVARASVANIECDRQAIVPENIRKFSDVLGVEIDLLIP